MNTKQVFHTIGVVAMAVLASTGPLSLCAQAPTTHTDQSVVSHYTLTVPTAELLAIVHRDVFNDSGRVYPCRKNPSCSSWGRDIVLSAPTLSVDGPHIVAGAHVSGSYPINQFFTPSIAGDVIISAVPVVIGNKIHLSQTTVTPGPGDVTFRTFITAFHQKMEEMITQQVVFDLAQYLAASSRDPNLPPPRFPDLHNVEATQITIESAATQPTPPALVAGVSVQLPKH